MNSTNPVNPVARCRESISFFQIVQTKIRGLQKLFENVDTMFGISRFLGIQFSIQKVEWSKVQYWNGPLFYSRVKELNNALLKHTNRKTTNYTIKYELKSRVSFTLLSTSQFRSLLHFPPLDKNS